MDAAGQVRREDAAVAVDGFELAYDRAGSGPGVVLLHGWPGDRTDYRDLVPLLGGCDVVVPDLRGFGHSDKHEAEPAAQYSGPAQARSVAGLITELGLTRPVVVGYDIGSRIAQALARARPDLVSALVIGPPVPGVGTRIFGVGPLREFWYQAFHRLPLSAELVDGNPEAVRAYLRHFWEHWSGPGFAVTEQHLDHLVSVYGPPGAFTASVQWYRAGAGTAAAAVAETVPAPEARLATPAVVLWPEDDPLFPREWSDRIGEFFSQARLRFVDGAGHFAPLEYPAVIAEEVRGFLPG
ncbi:MAG TPA: alpha/beta hydrolase [Trebonia sp.]|jgi:pimeloyl-ACP methyl ester carboxylesterase|nr:alpha/beta hydrolase [Trebonia sp.]